MTTPTNWVPGLAVLGFGTLGALVYLATSRRLKADAPAPQTSDDLQARYDALLIELKEHIANKHLQEPLKWETEKNRLEQAAAQVLKAKSQLQHEALKAEGRAAQVNAQAAADAGFFARNPALKGALIGGSVVAFFVFLGAQLSSQSKPREDGMTATGATPPMARGPMQMPEAPTDSEVPALLDAVKKAPEDADALANLSMYMIRKQAFDEARPFVQRGTLIDPFHVRLRVARTVLMAVDGNGDDAQRELERLGALYADGYEALMYAGLIAVEQNDSARALKNLEAYVAIAPQKEQPPFLRMALAQLRQPSGGQ